MVTPQREWVMAGPSTFEVIDRISGSSGGVYDVIADIPNPEG